MLSESILNSLNEQKRAVPIRFGGSLWLLDSRAAVYWPEQDVLLIADLHFEKGSYLSQHASPVPRYDSRATLNIIKELMNDYQPQTVMCLGDSFHDIGAFRRFIGEDLHLLQALIAEAGRWVWLIGNHDPVIPDVLAGERKSAEVLITRSNQHIYCQHIPDGSANLQIAGHFHPKASFASPVKKFRGKSLVTTDNLMLLPALGQYTGGLDVNDDVLVSLAPPRQRQCYVLCEQRVISLPKGC